MININEEIPYEKDGAFLDYAFGVGKFSEEHATFKNMELWIVGPLDIKKFETDFEDTQLRTVTKDVVKNFFTETSASVSCARVDYDFNLLPGEEERAESDYKETLSILQKYCEETGSRAVCISHFDQKNKDVNDALLTKHVHILYEEEPGAPSLLEKMMSSII